MTLAILACVFLAPNARAGEQVLFILDVSGSMSEIPGALDPSDLRFPSISLGPPTRFRLALEELERGLSAASRQGAATGLLAFGHRGGRCDDIEVAVPLGAVQEGAIRSFVRDLHPRGMTPLAAAIAMAEQHIRSRGQTGKVRVVLLTDGLEACSGDPFAAAASLRKVGSLDIVGIGLGPGEASYMGSLTAAGGGQLSLVGSGGLGGPRTSVSIPVTAPVPQTPTWGVGEVGEYRTPARAPAIAPQAEAGGPTSPTLDEAKPIVAPDSVPRLMNFTSEKPPKHKVPEIPRPAPSPQPELAPLPLL